MVPWLVMAGTGRLSSRLRRAIAAPLSTTKSPSSESRVGGNTSRVPPPHTPRGREASHQRMPSSEKKQMTSNARPAKVRHLNSTEINQSAENPWPNLAVEGLVSCFAARQGFPQGLQRSALGHGQIMFASLIRKIHVITMNHGENGLSPTFAGCIVLQTYCTYSLVANHQTNHVDVTFQTQKTCDPTIFNGSSGFLTDENS